MSRDRWEDMRNYPGDLKAAIPGTMGERMRSQAARKAEESRPAGPSEEKGESPAKRQAEGEPKTVRGTIAARYKAEQGAMNE
jgi:hypothetical protein